MSTTSMLPDSAGGEVSGREQLVSAARDLVPALRRSSQEAERAGQLPAEIARSMHDAGFFGLHVPAALGGIAAPIGTAVEVYTELARGSGAAAWCASILSTGGLVSGRFLQAGRDELWTEDPRAGVCGSTAPTGTGRRVPGGLRVSGTWQPVSGIHQARWLLSSVVVRGGADDSPGVVAAALPVQALRIERTWRMAGMAATGSDSATADDVFVPGHLVAPFAALLSAGKGEHTVEPLLGATAYSFSTVGAGAVLVGMGRAALEHTLTALSRGKAVAGSTYTDARDAPSVRRDVAVAAQLVDTAGLHLARAAADVQSGVEEDRQLDLATRARIRADLATISASVRQAMGHLLDAGGARTFALSSPVQQVWRDVEVLCRQPMFVPGISLDVYARSLLRIQEQVVGLV
ncbi:acyl-CoA dehydrogenase family protein [Kineococcus sp. GCM10028916]|uniref:acyl-CoA dehydrogenase family protein n=1 Tax=Kineococcus sp. GCM10028916 TaxID=3273394 RepID=UPI0036368951